MNLTPVLDTPTTAAAADGATPPTARDQNQQEIQRCFARNRRTVELRPSRALGTATTRVTLGDSLACTIEDGKHRLHVDMSPRHGGQGEGPDSGVLGRGALGSCYAIAIAMWAAERGVRLDALAVDVEADYDSRGLFFEDAASVGYREVRLVVRVTSPDPADEVQALLDEVEDHCPYLNVFRRPLSTKIDATVTSS